MAAVVVAVEVLQVAQQGRVVEAQEIQRVRAVLEQQTQVAGAVVLVLVVFRAAAQADQAS